MIFIVIFWSQKSRNFIGHWQNWIEKVWWTPPSPSLSPWSNLILVCWEESAATKEGSKSVEPEAGRALMECLQTAEGKAVIRIWMEPRGKERASRRKGDYGGTAPHLVDGKGTLATPIDRAGDGLLTARRSDFTWRYLFGIWGLDGTTCCTVAIGHLDKKIKPTSIHLKEWMSRATDILIKTYLDTFRLSNIRGKCP